MNSVEIRHPSPFELFVELKKLNPEAEIYFSNGPTLTLYNCRLRELKWPADAKFSDDGYFGKVIHRQGIWQFLPLLKVLDDFWSVNDEYLLA